MPFFSAEATTSDPAAAVFFHSMGLGEHGSKSEFPRQEKIKSHSS